MNEFATIKKELEITKRELELRLRREQNILVSTEIGIEFLLQHEEVRKRNFVMHNVSEDLRDVKRALAKIDEGLYGVCEETGLEMSLKQLEMLPTARTIYDFTVFHQ